MVEVEQNKKKLNYNELYLQIKGNIVKLFYYHYDKDFQT